MKTIIYQLLPRTFANFRETCKPNGTKKENGCGTMNAISSTALKSIYNLGATHIWYTGIIRHATAEMNTPAIVKGLAGSPYAITDYYDVDPDIAENKRKRMSEFEELVQRTHDAKLGVIIDFVPNHVAREYHSSCKPKGVVDLGEKDHPEWAFSPLNDFYYLPGQAFVSPTGESSYQEYPAKVTGNDCFSASPSKNDWYETIKLNYGIYYQNGGEKQFSPIPSLWPKMLEILLFWAGKGVDGFRCDMAEMVPEEFWKWCIEKVKEQYPKILFIAEVYNPTRYKNYITAGFDYLYDKVGMYDYLRGVTSKNWPVEGISQQWQAVDDIRDHMLYFLENHDEQRIASGFFSGRGVCAEPAMIVAATLGTNPLLIYSGQETGETAMMAEGFSGVDGRSSIFDYTAIPSLRAWANNGAFDGKGLNKEQKELRSFYQHLLHIARKEKAITEGKMFDLEYAQGFGFNKHEHFAYVRHSKKQTLLIVLNFDDRQAHMCVRLPKEMFQYLQIEEQSSVIATDLLEKQTYTLPFCSTEAVELTLNAWKGVILQIN